MPQIFHAKNQALILLQKYIHRKSVGVSSGFPAANT